MGGGGGGGGDRENEIKIKSANFVPRAFPFFVTHGREKVKALGTRLTAPFHFLLEIAN